METMTIAAFEEEAVWKLEKMLKTHFRPIRPFPSSLRRARCIIMFIHHAQEPACRTPAGPLVGVCRLAEDDSL